MKIPEIETVCFVGAGTMGCFNALMAAVAGYRAVIYDISQEALNAVPETLSAMGGFLVNQGFFQAATMPDALARITVNSDLGAATANVQLVSESVAERLEVKRAVHRDLDRVCNASTLITTNTSSLLVSQIEDVLVHGDRFAALHSHLGSLLIDIVGGPRASATTVDVLERYVLSLQAVPLVLKKENHGYVFNALLAPLLTAADMLVIDGHAKVQEVDRTWMRYQEAPIGPFGLMDFFGLNIIYDSWQEVKPERAHLQDKVLSFLSPYIEKNNLGVKTGEGFYTYPQPQYQEADFIDPEQDLSAIYQPLRCVLIANAIFIAHKNVAEPADIDRAWTVSLGLTQGPFAVLDEMGVDAFLEVVVGMEGAEGLLTSKLAGIVAEYLQTYKA